MTIFSRNGKDETYRIGSLVELDWAFVDTEAILSALADKKIRILTLTIIYCHFCNYPFKG